MISYKQIIVPICLLVGLLVAYIFSGKYLLDKLFFLRKEIVVPQEEGKELKRKLVVLQDSDASVNTFKDKVVLALPDANPILVGIAQIRKIASEEGAGISNLAGGQPTSKGNLSQTLVSFDLDANTQQAFNVFRKISNSAPLSTLTRLSLSKQTESSRFSLSLNFYWAPLPQTITAVTGVSNQLSEAEEAVLRQISTLSYPELGEDSTAPVIRGSVPDRDDPFTAE